MFNEETGGRLDGLRSTLVWWLFWARVGAVSVEVFLHKRFGQRYCRLQAFMVIPLGMFYTWVWEWQGYDIRPLVKFFVAYVIALVIAQIGILIRLRRGDQEHSQYNGWPVILGADKADKERMFKQVVEPLMVLGFGWIVYQSSLPLGAYLMFAAVSLFVMNGLNQLWQRGRIVDMQDAVFEQQATAGGFRERQGG
jgi:hypothetical protein